MMKKSRDEISLLEHNLLQLIVAVYYISKLLQYLSANILYIYIISSTKSFAYPHVAAACRAEQNGMMMGESIPVVPPPHPPPPPSTNDVVAHYHASLRLLSILTAIALSSP